MSGLTPPPPHFHSKVVYHLSNTAGQVIRISLGRICVLMKRLTNLLYSLFPPLDLIVKVIQQNMGGIKIEEWRKVRLNDVVAEGNPAKNVKYKISIRLNCYF